MEVLVTFFLVHFMKLGQTNGLNTRPIHFLFLEINWIKSGQVKQFKKATGKQIELYKNTQY